MIGPINQKSLLEYKTKYDGMTEIFYHFSRYNDFNDEPIVGLAFSMTRRSYPPKYTTFSALIPISKTPNYQPFLYGRFAYNGYLLEVATTTACVVSSHAKGFCGMSIAEWLPIFFDELNFFEFQSVSTDGSKLIDSVHFTNNWSTTHIPYFCPQVSGTFSRDVVSKITALFPKCKLGVVNSNIGNEYGPRDFFFEMDNTVILNGECKMWGSSFDGSDLNSTIENFEKLQNTKRGFAVHIIVAREFAKFQKCDFPDDYVIYQAVHEFSNNASNIHQYSIKRIHPFSSDAEDRQASNNNTSNPNIRPNTRDINYCESSDIKYSNNSDSSSKSAKKPQEMYNSCWPQRHCPQCC